MILHIRPHQLFTAVSATTYQERLVSVVLPHDRTPMLLETAVLLSLIKLVRPRTVFEFGTYLGIQTLNMAVNLEPGAVIYTLDLDEASFQGAEQLEADQAITRRHLAHQHALAFESAELEARVIPLLGDSNDFDFTPYEESIDLIYVDGGHDERTVRADTDHALQMLASDHSAVVCWHDYGSKSYPAVTALLRDLSGERDLFHVEETMMCFTMQGFDPSPPFASSLRRG